MNNQDIYGNIMILTLDKEKDKDHLMVGHH